MQGPYRWVAVIVFSPALLLALFLNYLSPDSIRARTILKTLLNLVYVAAWLGAAYYWLTQRAGYGFAAIVMFCNLQIADAYPNLWSHMHRGYGRAITYLLGWFIVFGQISWHRYMPDRVYGWLAFGAFVIMILVYLQGTYALVFRHRDMLTEDLKNQRSSPKPGP
jgi:hypothetical protein